MYGLFCHVNFPRWGDNPWKWAADLRKKVNFIWNQNKHILPNLPNWVWIISFISVSPVFCVFPMATFQFSLCTPCIFRTHSQSPPLPHLSPFPECLSPWWGEHPQCRDTCLDTGVSAEEGDYCTANHAHWFFICVFFMSLITNFVDESATASCQVTP